jgi:DNA polymerase-3 subunit beta
MKIECSKEKLEKALMLAERATSKNPTLPILSYVLLETGSSVLNVKSTNLEIGLDIDLPAKVLKEGSVAIKASALLGFLSNSDSDSQVIMEAVSGNLNVKTKNGHATIKGVSVDDFPKTQKITGATSVVINGSLLSGGIRSVFYSASVSHVKPELASVVLFGEGKHLFFVSTDSFRLAEKKVDTDSAKEISQTIIPIKNANELARIAEDFEKDKVELLFGKNQIALQAKGVYFVSRVVDGSFPDYRQIIPKEHKTEAVVLKEDFLRAIRSTTVFSDSFNQIVISVSPETKKMELRSKNNDIGEGTTTVQSAISGEPMEISFNHRYLLDCFSSVNSDSISISFSGSNKPALIRGVSESSFLYVVMPMNK